MTVKLTIHQDDTLCNTTSECLVTTKKPMQMTADIHDPSNFFKDAFIDFLWVYGDGSKDKIHEKVTTF